MEGKRKGDFWSFMNLWPVAICTAGILRARLRGCPFAAPGGAAALCRLTLRGPERSGLPWAQALPSGKATRPPWRDRYSSI